jgi:hypothetical protein
LEDLEEELKKKLELAIKEECGDSGETGETGDLEDDEDDIYL